MSMPSRRRDGMPRVGGELLARASSGTLRREAPVDGAADCPDRPLLADDAPDDVLVPPSLPVVETMGATAEGRAWLAELPHLVRAMRDAWSLRIAAPLHAGSCSWVAFAWTPEGRSAALKIGRPHREAAGEPEALRLWQGGPAVRLLRDDEERSAMLLERCVPGTRLVDAAGVPVRRRLLTGAELLAELWSAEPPAATRIESLAAVTGEWADLLEERAERLSPRAGAADAQALDPGLPVLGARLLRELPATASRSVVLHGDFNPGNVLATRRRPWVAIDPKPMIGDPGYDPWPLLDQIDDPFARADSTRVVARRWELVAEAVGEDSARLHAWAAARGIESAYYALDHDDRVAAVRALSRASTHVVLAGL